jgi:hypothetical protein
MGKVKELQMNIQYILNVLSAHGEQKAIEAFENVRNALAPMSEPLSAQDVSIGQKIHRMAELRYLLEGLDDHDLIVIEACDEHGDVEDLYPMYVDVIENVRLTDGTIVREVRFCQMPNTEV